MELGKSGDIHPVPVFPSSAYSVHPLWPLPASLWEPWGHFTPSLAPVFPDGHSLARHKEVGADAGLAAPGPACSAGWVI